MRILRLLGLIIEFIVAAAIFVILAQKTPLFDRVIPGRSAGLSSSTNQTSSNTPDTNMPIIHTGIITPPKTVEPPQDIAPIPLSVYERQSNLTNICTTPRGETLRDSQSTTAYLSPNSNNKDNTCLAQLRVCNRGKLSGSYSFKSCNFVIDGKRGNNIIITGANNSNSNLVPETAIVQEQLKANKEYIQPTTLSQKDIPIYTKSTKQYLMENSSTDYSSNNTIDVLDQEIPTPNDNQYRQSCSTPRGSTVRDGSFVYAYDRNSSTIHTMCKVEKRGCIHGKLSGTFTYKSCDEGVSQKEKTSDTLQSLARTENDRLGAPGIVREANTSTTLPDTPRNRSRNELMSDKPVAINHGHSYNSPSNSGQNNGNGQNGNPSRVSPPRPNPYTNPPRPNPQGIHNSELITPNSQLTTHNSCLSPRGTAVAHGQSITTYRLPTTTNNSLCDPQIRTCRDGRLRGNYTYPSCTQAPKATPPKSTNSWIKNTRKTSTNRVKNAGKDSSKRIKKATHNTGHWIKNAATNTRKRVKNIF